MNRRHWKQILTGTLAGILLFTAGFVSPFASVLAEGTEETEIILADKEDEVVENEFVLTVDDRFSAKALERNKIVESVETLSDDTAIVTFTENSSEEEQVAVLEKQAHVDIAEPNYVFDIMDDGGLEPDTEEKTETEPETEENTKAEGTDVAKTENHIVLDIVDGYRKTNIEYWTKPEKYGELYWPVASDFGEENVISDGEGEMLITVPEGTPVYATGSGAVLISENSEADGNHIVIDHGAGFYTEYLHLSERNVQEGDVVTIGQVIGRSGATGYVEEPVLGLYMAQSNDGFSYEYRENPECRYCSDPTPLSEIYNDTRIDEQYYLKRLGFLESWTISEQQKTPKIAVIDTGANMDAKDIKFAINRDLSVDVTKQDENGNYLPCENDAASGDGHGTGIVSVIAATINNKTGIAGVMGSSPADIFMVQVMNPESKAITLSSLIKGINYAVEQKADVINISLGTYTNTDDEIPSLKAAIDAAYDAGCIVVASAGNGKNNNGVGKEQPMYPAAYKNVIGVMGVDRKGERSSFSDYGQYYDVYSYAEEIVFETSKDEYKTGSGTSLATALVSAEAALLVNQNPLVPQPETEEESDAEDEKYELAPLEEVFSTTKDTEEEEELEYIFDHKEIMDIIRQMTTGIGIARADIATGTMKERGEKKIEQIRKNLPDQDKEKEDEKEENPDTPEGYVEVVLTDEIKNGIRKVNGLPEELVIQDPEEFTWKETAYREIPYYDEELAGSKYQSEDETLLIQMIQDGSVEMPKDPTDYFALTPLEGCDWGYIVKIYTDGYHIPDVLHEMRGYEPPAPITEDALRKLYELSPSDDVIQSTEYITDPVKTTPENTNILAYLYGINIETQYTSHQEAGERYREVPDSWSWLDQYGRWQTLFWQYTDGCFSICRNHGWSSNYGWSYYEGLAYSNGVGLMLAQGTTLGNAYLGQGFEHALLTGDYSIWEAFCYGYVKAFGGNWDDWKDGTALAYYNVSRYTYASTLWGRHDEQTLATWAEYYTYTVYDYHIAADPNGGTFENNDGWTLSGGYEWKTISTTTYYTDFTYGNLPNNITKDYYTLNGWNTQANGSGTDITSNSKVSLSPWNYTDAVIYAQWKPNVLTIQYNANYGYISGSAYTVYKLSSSDLIQDSSGTAISDSKNYEETIPVRNGTETFGLVRPGYEFAGWGLSRTELKIDKDKASIKVSELKDVTGTNGKTLKTSDTTIVLYAIWTPSSAGSIIQLSSQNDLITQTKAQNELSSGGFSRDFQQVEYVTVNNGAYFDTGIAAGDNMEAEAIAKITNNPTSKQTILSAGNKGSENFQLYTYHNLTYLENGPAGTEGEILASKTGYIANSEINQFTMKRGNGILQIRVAGKNDVREETIRALEDMILIGVSKNSAGSVENAANGVFYSIRIWKNGALVGDFVPCYCLRDIAQGEGLAYRGNAPVSVSANTIGFYDCVSKRFQVNAGSGTVGKGEKVQNTVYLDDEVYTFEGINVKYENDGKADAVSSNSHGIAFIHLDMTKELQEIQINGTNETDYYYENSTTQKQSLAAGEVNLFTVQTMPHDITTTVVSTTTTNAALSGRTELDHETDGIWTYLNPFFELKSGVMSLTCATETELRNAWQHGIDPVNAIVKEEFDDALVRPGTSIRDGAAVNITNKGAAGYVASYGLGGKVVVTLPLRHWVGSQSIYGKHYVDKSAKSVDVSPEDSILFFADPAEYGQILLTAEGFVKEDDAVVLRIQDTASENPLYDMSILLTAADVEDGGLLITNVPVGTHKISLTDEWTWRYNKFENVSITVTKDATTTCSLDLTSSGRNVWRSGTKISNAGDAKEHAYKSTSEDGSYSDVTY